MKKVLLALIFCLMTTLAFADASFEIISKDIDNNGNIRVWTIHKVDGVEVPSNYPKINDHYVYATRYNKQNFLVCNDKVEIEQYVLDSIQTYSKVLIQKEFDKKAPKTLNEIRVDYNSAANTDFSTINLDKIIGKKVTTIEASQLLDTDNDGELDKEIIVRTDGTKTETPYTPAVTP